MSIGRSLSWLLCILDILPSLKCCCFSFCFCCSCWNVVEKRNVRKTSKWIKMLEKFMYGWIFFSGYGNIFMKPTIDCLCNGSKNTESYDIFRKCRFLKILVSNRVRIDSSFLSFEATLRTSSVNCLIKTWYVPTKCSLSWSLWDLI